MTTNVEGQTAWVNLLHVPRELRHEGIGREMFERWEHALPPAVKRIRLLAVDMDGFAATEFWRSLGFEFDETDPDVTEIVGTYMSKTLHSVPAEPVLEPVETEMVSEIDGFGGEDHVLHDEQFEHDMAAVV